MSFDPLELERISPTPGLQTGPQGSPPTHIPERIPELLPLSTLLVPTLVINDGDSAMVVLYRIKEHVKKLTEAHNALAKRIENNELADEGIFFDEMHQFTEEDMKKLMNIPRFAKGWHTYQPKDQTFDVVGWLYAIRYTCNCVGSVPYWGRYTYWCAKCNRLILEND